jgi:hypothetical protein
MSVIADPKTAKAVGIYVEAFERRFVKKHEQLEPLWPVLKESLAPQPAWSQLLQLISFWLIAVLRSSLAQDGSGNPTLQPA